MEIKQLVFSRLAFVTSNVMYANSFSKNWQPNGLLGLNQLLQELAQQAALVMFACRVVETFFARVRRETTEW